MYSVLIFIQLLSTFMFIKLHYIQELYQFKMCNIYILFLIYPFKSFLSIQQFFIHSTFTAHLSLRMEVTHFLQPVNQGQRRSNGILKNRLCLKFQPQPLSKDCTYFQEKQAVPTIWV